VCHSPFISRPFHFHVRSLGKHVYSSLSNAVQCATNCSVSCSASPPCANRGNGDARGFLSLHPVRKPPFRLMSSLFLALASAVLCRFFHISSRVHQFHLCFHLCSLLSSMTLHYPSLPPPFHLSPSISLPLSTLICNFHLSSHTWRVSGVLSLFCGVLGCAHIPLYPYHTLQLCVNVAVSSTKKGLTDCAMLSVCCSACV
jgi:hypothetical protein